MEKSPAKTTARARRSGATRILPIVDERGHLRPFALPCVLAVMVDPRDMKVIKEFAPRARARPNPKRKPPPATDEGDTDPGGTRDTVAGRLLRTFAALQTFKKLGGTIFWLTSVRVSGPAC